MRHFPPVLLAARSCGVGSWVLVGASLKNGPPPSLKGVHAGRLDYYNNNNQWTSLSQQLHWCCQEVGWRLLVPTLRDKYCSGSRLGHTIASNILRESPTANAVTGMRY